MKRREVLILTGVVVVFILTVVSCATVSRPSEERLMLIEDPREGIEGVWLGTLEVSATKLRMVIKISKGPDGRLTATMDSPDQGATDIPVEEVTFEDGNLHLDVKVAGAIISGKVAEDFLMIEAQWEQGGNSLPLLLKAVDEVGEVLRPQDPTRPYPYDEEEVIYENESAGIILAGTLTLPRSEGPFPAVLLITGSGPQDRNNTILGHRSFLVLADYLTRLGISVLRVDDRGVGGSSGDFSQSTSEDFAEDVLAGVDFLKSRKEIDPNKIGLIGHSEGGIIAPMVAVKSGDVAFIVLMAGSGLTGEEIEYLQTALITKSAGRSDEDIVRARVLQEQVYDVLKRENDNIVAEKELRQIYEETLVEEDKKEVGDLEAHIQSQVRFVLNPWFRFFLTYDPRPTLMKVKIPVLAINGEKDLQSPPRENLAAIEEALKAGGNENYTVMELPGLNHLFQTAGSGSPSEYAKIDETISPTALKVIGNWIVDQI